MLEGDDQDHHVHDVHGQVGEEEEDIPEDDHGDGQDVGEGADLGVYGSVFFVPCCLEGSCLVNMF